MSNLKIPRKNISSFDCIMICSVIALSLSKKTVKKLSYRYNLVPKQKGFDYGYGFYRLHEQAHDEEGTISKALTNMLNRQHVRYVRQLEEIDSTDINALTSFVEEGMSVSPGGVLWSLLSEPRDELQSQGVYYAHKLVYERLQSVAHGNVSYENTADTGQQDETMCALREENIALQKEVKKLAGKLDRTDRKIIQMEREREHLEKRNAELEDRPHRENRLCRENRILRYRISELERTNESKSLVDNPVVCTMDNQMEQASDMPSCEESLCVQSGDCPLDALRIAVVGGLDRLETRYRKIVERLGGEFVFHNGYCNNGTHTLKNMVCGSDIIVFITSVNSHNAMWTVKAECRKSGKKITILKQTSPDALEKTLLAEVAG